MRKINSNFRGRNIIEGFTFIELIISISIMAILSILGFISYSKNLEDSRDSGRESDLSYMANALKLHKTKRGNYPSPSQSFNIVNSGTLAAIQGKISDEIVISTLDKIPLDPFTKKPYVYSIWKNKAEFQLAATLENNGVNKAILKGDYKVASKNLLPTIILATYGSSNVEINELIGSGSENRKTFVFDNSTHNLPYTFEEPFYPYSDYLAFTGFLNDPSINWQQDNNYKNCNDIYSADKNIGTGEYQVNNYGTLENVICTPNNVYKSCKEIKDSLPLSGSGQYSIMPEGVTRKLDVYCDMTTASGGWTLVAKSGTSKNYIIGHCNFMDPPNTITEDYSFIYWACDLDQNEMLFKTEDGWIIGTNKGKEDCGTSTTKTNNNTCSWTGATSQTIQITTLSGGCMTGLTLPIYSSLWWKGADWEPTVTKNLSGLSTVLNGVCNSVTGFADTSYCSLFDIYDNIGNGIGQSWSYRGNNCLGLINDNGATLSPKTHLIFVR